MKLASIIVTLAFAFVANANEPAAATAEPTTPAAVQVKKEDKAPMNKVAKHMKKKHKKEVK